MKLRIANHRTTRDSAQLILAKTLDSDEAKVLRIIPTTAETLKTAADFARVAHHPVVGLREHFEPTETECLELLSPEQFLSICRNEKYADHYRSVVIFSDQFVSAEYAPILVRHGTQHNFYPSLEVIAVTQYGFSISYWNGNSFIPPIAASSEDHTTVLRVLRQYYEACEVLGQNWLMRERQHQRTITGRIEIAKYRLRLYQSIVMLSIADDADMLLRTPLLEELHRLRELLPRRPIL